MTLQHPDAVRNPHFHLGRGVARAKLLTTLVVNNGLPRIDFWDSGSEESGLIHLTSIDFKPIPNGAAIKLLGCNFLCNQARASACNA